MEEDLIFRKATLALGGKVKLPEGFEVPVRVSHSTSGPAPAPIRWRSASGT
ncbi:hypothetical protein [Candidatus Methanomethylophilus sp. 1R26]|uniref:hypothetical protein n=1 Tax=Candidatus Methanomethylophilus sp. 1R26 TaxID=1769296 RepID=UPI0012FEA865|nr:hypothetical protein [Candidatus Methanomethylophilus sp. 1R26]